MTICKLPTELLSLILRYLDGRSLINASRVNNLWYQVCKKDPLLRNRIKGQELKRRRVRWRGSKNLSTSTRICKLPKDLILKRKIKLAKYKLLITLRTLRDLWQEFHDSLLSCM